MFLTQLHTHFIHILYANPREIILPHLTNLVPVHHARRNLLCSSFHFAFFLWDEYILKYFLFKGSPNFLSIFLGRVHDKFLMQFIEFWTKLTKWEHQGISHPRWTSGQKKTFRRQQHTAQWTGRSLSFPTKITKFFGWVHICSLSNGRDNTEVRWVVGHHMSNRSSSKPPKHGIKNPGQPN